MKRPKRSTRTLSPDNLSSKVPQVSRNEGQLLPLTLTRQSLDTIDTNVSSESLCPYIVSPSFTQSCCIELSLRTYEQR